MPGELEVRSAQDLLESPLASVTWLVEELIPTGLVVLAGTPKVGKSWFCLWLAICVSTGRAFLDHATERAGVLYLCLEDTFGRIQNRLFHLVDVANDDLKFAIVADKLNNGLTVQLERFVSAQPTTRLVIIDTLQKVRVATGDSVYASDYQDIGLLKAFADKNGLCILLVHHTRKMGDEANIFNTISGSNGILGAADECLLLSKDAMFDGKATLSITGRDVDLAEYKLAFNDCRWQLVEQTSREELREREVPSCVMSVLDFMATRPGAWEGTATQLIADAALDDATPAVLAKRLNEYRTFLAERGVEYGFRRTATARLITLTHAHNQN